jgi:hypothetical protein
MIKKFNVNSFRCSHHFTSAKIALLCPLFLLPGHVHHPPTVSQSIQLFRQAFVAFRGRNRLLWPPSRRFAFL